MEQLHTDISIGLSAAFGAAVTLILGTAIWLGVWFVSWAGEQFATAWRATSAPGL